jgi:hypothetical protein
MKTMSAIRYEDWRYDYKYKNPFAFLGNGKVAAEYLTKAKRLVKLVPYVRIADTPRNIE